MSSSSSSSAPHQKRRRMESSRVSYRPLLVGAYEYYQKEMLNSLVSLKPKTHYETVTNQVKTKQKNYGDVRLTNIRKLLDNVKGYDRSEMQKQFHESFLQAVALHLYKDDPEVDMDKIMSMNEWPNLKQQCLCLTPRRFGKTTAVAMFVASYFLSVEKAQLCIFSTGKRASDGMLDKVHEFIKLIDEQMGTNYDKTCKRKGEFLFYYGEGNDVRKVASYPSGSDKLRGVGGDLILLEEAAFMPIKMFHEVIVPLLELETTALICISTPQDSNNFYSMMFEMVDAAGDKLFNQIQISMVCEDCKLSAHPEKCTHMKHLLPKWKSGGKQDMVRQIYGDNTEDMLRESMGVTTNDSNSLFQDDWLDLFTKRAPYTSPATPRVIFVACDPNGGGSSQMAIVSLYQDSNNFAICGMESHAVKGYGEIRNLLETHVRAIRNIFPSSWIIFVPESNLGHEASHMSHMLKDIPKCRSLMERGEPGVITTHKRKELYSNTAVERFASSGVWYASQFICVNPYGDANARGARVKRMFRKQMGIFSKIVIPRGSNHSKPKIIYSGKDQGNDDLVLTFMIALYWSIQFMTGRSNPSAKDIL
tara:strand:- start:10621 stop:12387 length:1767 start_codon:yes stop_codon:yes gene_type:complete